MSVYVRLMMAEPTNLTNYADQIQIFPFFELQYSVLCVSKYYKSPPELGSVSHCQNSKSFAIQPHEDTYSTVAKRGSVFIGIMTPNGAIWSRY